MQRSEWRPPALPTGPGRGRLYLSHRPSRDDVCNCKQLRRWHCTVLSESGQKCQQALEDHIRIGCEEARCCSRQAAPMPSRSCAYCHTVLIPKPSSKGCATGGSSQTSPPTWQPQMPWVLVCPADSAPRAKAPYMQKGRRRKSDSRESLEAPRMWKFGFHRLIERIEAKTSPVPPRVVAGFSNDRMMFRISLFGGAKSLARRPAASASLTGT